MMNLLRPESAPLLTIVVPAYNEERNIPVLHKALRRALAGQDRIEILFVDDGSEDDTAACIRALRALDPDVRFVRFSRNFGHQAALVAGLEAARGAAVVTLDCDLQHPPELIPRMIDAWRGGAKVVQMVRTASAGTAWPKRFTSTLFYRLVNLLSETPLTAGAADYQLLDRVVVDAVLQFRDRFPFLRGLVGWLGFSPVRIDYTAPPRTAGRSGYTVGKMLHLSVRAITGLSAKPLRFAFYLGLATAAFCAIYAVFAVIAMVAGHTVEGWTSVIVTVLFLGAVQLVSLGILGEYIARIYEQSRGVPRYVIAECDQESAGERSSTGPR
jgi:dolichol-phosphate mannosyltransferase